MRLTAAILLVLLLCMPCMGACEGKISFGKELNVHAGWRPFTMEDFPNISKHFSLGVAATGIRESPTNTRQVGIDDWSIGGYLEMALIDLSSVWPQLPVLGEGHAGVEFMHTLEKRASDRNALLQMVPYVGLCVGVKDLPDIFTGTDVRYYEDRGETVLGLFVLFLRR